MMNSANLYNSAFSIGLASCLAFAAPVAVSCGGRLPGDERNYWLSGLVDPSAHGATDVYVGMDEVPQVGFLESGFFSAPNEIPRQGMGRNGRVLNMIFQGLCEDTMDVTDPTVARMLSNDVFLFMTDQNAWPNAYYSRGMAKAYSFQVLDSDYDEVSNCKSGSCRYEDVIVIKNEGLDPKSTDITSLSPAERGTLATMTEWISEELASDLWMDGMNEAFRKDYGQKVGDLWAAGSTGEEGDRFLSDLWLDGGIAFALSEDGIESYTLHGQVQSAIAKYKPTASQAERFDMEVAIISYLQLVGEHAGWLVGTPGKNYYEFYRQSDIAVGKTPGSYSYYRGQFISRESLSHLAKIGSFRCYFPSFLRASLDGPFRKKHLDARFNDGSANAAIRSNPYLSNYQSLHSLVEALAPNIIPQGE